ncbi:hypothetical protein GCM10009092_37440 [Bowmanella denitrificans]|uniref:N-acetyltransferase domain-containing protein n=1 Tax=Bowmanella denitrificans TaxID=366582 RepID=A0ABN0XPN8_9ALTE
MLRSVIRNSSDLVFEIHLADWFGKQPPLDDAFEVHVIDSVNVDEVRLAWIVDKALAAENEIYRQPLRKKDCMVAITQGKSLVHTSFVQFESRYKKLLSEDGDSPLIGNCWTAPDCRGKGLYPFAIEKCCEEMVKRGVDRVLISCSPDNHASIAGIKKSGFTLVRKVSTVLLLTKLLVQVNLQNDSRSLRLGVL